MSTRTLRANVLFLGAGWSFAIVSFLLDLNYSLGLFGRSGSLLVLLALIAEYRLINARNAFHSRQLADHSGGVEVDFEVIHPGRAHRSVEIAAHITTILGTLIWGYGDLVFR